MKNKSTHSKFLTLLFLLIFSEGTTFAQDIDYTDTLSLSNRKIMKGFSGLDSIVADKKLFIAGENHTYRSSNSDLWVQNIKYLYVHAGVRNVIMESGLSTSWLANQYVLTGDTALYNVLKKYMYKEYAERYKKLYRFNRNLDSGEKVQVFGIDLERGSFGSVKVLSMLIPDSVTAPDSIDLHIESILGMAMYQDREIFDGTGEANLLGYTYSVSSTLKLVIENHENHADLYKDYLKGDYDLFRKILMGLKETIRWRSFDKEKTVQGYIFREKYMYNRFVELIDSNPGKYYGQFGRCHATTKKADKNSCEWYVFKSLANRIRQDERLGLASDMLTFGILYDNESDYADDDWQKVGSHIKGLFGNLDENRVMLYDLPKDSTLSEFFVDDFNYLFLNSYQPSVRNPYLTDFLLGYDFETTGSFKLTYFYGLHDMSLSSLGSLHANQDKELFNEYTEWQGGNMIFSEEGIVSVTNVGFLKSIKTTTSDSFGTTLSGFTLNNYIFYDALPNVKALDVLFGGALGYSVLNFKVKENTESTGPITTGFLGDRRQSIYRNPAFTARLSVGLNINLGRFTFGGEIG
ncbi:MAG: hypothetical protein ACI9JN_002146, partial [Bacteroidia bacterium]